MQHRLKIASSALVLVIAAGAAQACGHLPFEDLPNDQDASPTVDGSLADSSSGNPADGNVLPDGRVSDGGDRDASDEDARIIEDAAPPDAACATTGDCHVIYVAPAPVGDDANAGTSDKPVRTIKAALNLVTSLRHELHVATGNYGPFALTTKQDVQIFGGFLCDKGNCNWSPNTSGEETVVSANDLTGGALVVGDGATRATVIERIHFKGAQGVIDAANANGAVTVLINGGTPTLNKLFIEGGNSKGGIGPQRRTATVLVRGTQADAHGPLFNGCTIIGGVADGEASGLVVEELITATPSHPAVEIVGSTIKGGSAPSTIALHLSSVGPKTVVRDSTILASPSNSNGSVASEAWAIVLDGAASILRNRINQGVNGDYCKFPGSVCGGIATNNANATIQNNLINGVGTQQNSAALLIGTSDDKDRGQLNVNSNVLDGNGSSANGAISAAIMLRSTNEEVSMVGTVRNNILLGGKGKSSYGVYELASLGEATHLLSLEHNDIVADTALYHAWFAPVGGNPSATTKDYDFAKLDTAPAKSVGGNIGDECPLVNEFHLKDKNSPCIDQGLDEGAPAGDLDSPPTPRPQGNAPDIGADEFKPG